MQRVDGPYSVKIEPLHTVMVAACLVLTSCASRQDSSSAVDTAAIGAIPAAQADEVAAETVSSVTEPSYRPGHIALPQSLRLPGVDSVKAARSWQEAVSRYSEDERRFLHARSAAYFYVLEFGSEQQQRQMIEQGFPMPEEWLAARNMSDEDLKRLAETGNAKAQMFYIDRSISVLSAVLSQRGLDTKNAQDMQLLQLYASVSAMTHRRLIDSKSPFAAYQDGLFETRTSRTQTLEPFAASIHIAAELGHAGADQLSNVFYQQHPGLDPGTVMHFYQSMRRQIGRP